MSRHPRPRPFDHAAYQLPVHERTHRFRRHPESFGERGRVMHEAARGRIQYSAIVGGGLCDERTPSRRQSQTPTDTRTICDEVRECQLIEFLEKRLHRTPQGAGQPADACEYAGGRTVAQAGDEFVISLELPHDLSHTDLGWSFWKPQPTSAAAHLQPADDRRRMIDPADPGCTLH
jgi:hypothetical protein